MKKSKLFLTASLVVMTLAAVASTAGMKKIVPSYWYKKGTACVFVNTQIACSPADTPNCQYIDPATSSPYNTYAEATCLTPLSRDQF